MGEYKCYALILVRFFTQSTLTWLVDLTNEQFYSPDDTDDTCDRIQVQGFHQDFEKLDKSLVH